MKNLSILALTIISFSSLALFANPDSVDYYTGFRPAEPIDTTTQETETACPANDSTCPDCTKDETTSNEENKKPEPTPYPTSKQNDKSNRREQG